MFAGIGGFRAGLTRAGGFRCVGHCEIDKHADASYRAIHDVREEERYDPDARTIHPNDLPDFDLLCGGFPCQAFSLAGRRKGFADARGTLFFEIARLAEAKRPSYLLLENVPGLLSHDGGRTFAAILTTLSDLGYHVEWTVLNSKHFGVPQSRKRVFLICYLDPRCAGYDVVCGTFFLAGVGDGTFTSLTDEQLRCYQEKYSREMVFTVADRSNSDKTKKKERHPHER